MKMKLKGNEGELKMKWDESYLTRTRRGETQKKRERANTNTGQTWPRAGKPWKGKGKEKRRPTDTEQDQRRGGRTEASETYASELSPSSISHGVPSVHPVVASVSLLPNGALPKQFPTASPPSTRSSLPSGSFPTELSTSISHGFFSVHPIVASIRSLPTEFPQAISHGFPSVHPLVTSVSVTRSKCD